MQLFYTNNIQGEFAYLSEEEAKHCTQVLRKKAGDAVQLIDGNGGFYKGVIDEVSKKNCIIKINESTLEFNKRDFKLHIAIAPTKNIARIEWFAEKAVELGIDEITPLLCKHSERKNIRIDRLEKITLSATKQSIKAYLPKVNELTKFNDFIKKTTTTICKYIAYVDENNVSHHLKDIYKKGTDTLILIGPEGDFSKEEIQLAFQANFQAVGLGKSRLRTETAGVAACHIINLLNE